MGEKLNWAKGPTAVLVSMKPHAKAVATGIKRQEQWRAFRESFPGKIRPGIKVIMMEEGQEAPLFVETILGLFDETMPG